MTFRELAEEIEKLFPEGEILEDSDGQIVVYTGLIDLATNEHPELSPFSDYQEEIEHV